MLKHLVVSLALLTAMPALASSDDAWAEFSAEVERGCLAATEGMLENATATVDPFGSESYGMAIVSGEVSTGKPTVVLCVLDKQSKAVQVGGELALSITPNL